MQTKLGSVGPILALSPWAKAGLTAWNPVPKPYLTLGWGFSPAELIHLAGVTFKRQGAIPHLYVSLEMT